MKLFRCRECSDVLAVRSERRSCACGASSAEYMRDNARVSVDGPCDVLALSNRGLANMLAGSFDSAALYLVKEPNNKVLR